MIIKKILFAISLIVLMTHPAFALSTGEQAPVFSLRDNSGNFFYLSNYIGGRNKENIKGIILNFFASHCKPCKNELPVINSLVDEFKNKGIKIVVVGYKEDFDKIDEMLAGLKVDKPVILSDPYGKTGEKYGVKGLPMTVFIGSDGRVKDIIRGELPNIEKVVREKAGRLFK